MNMEVQTLDSLRKLVRELQDENKKLKEQLKKANIAFPEQSVFEEKIEDSEEYDPDQGGRIMNRYITEDMANRYFAMFGEEPMSMPKGEGMEAIFLNVITDGMTNYVQNSVVRR